MRIKHKPKPPPPKKQQPVKLPKQPGRVGKAGLPAPRDVFEFPRIMRSSHGAEPAGYKGNNVRIDKPGTNL